MLIWSSENKSKLRKENTHFLRTTQIYKKKKKKKLVEIAFLVENISF